MTHTKTLVAKFVKIAEDMMNTANGQSDGTLSPDEAQEALGIVVDEIQAIIDAIPGEGAQEEEAETPVEGNQGQPEQSVKPAQDTKIAELETTVKSLTEKLEKKEREDIAENYAELFDQAQHDAKVKEVIESKDSNEIWSTKTEAISKYNESKTEAKSQYRPAQSFSYTKVAKRDDRLMYL